MAANVFAVLLAVYFCQGLVIAQFYMRRWRSPFWVVGLVYVFIVVEWLLATGVTLLGVFDLWADFRRLNPRPLLPGGKDRRGSLAASAYPGATHRVTI